MAVDESHGYPAAFNGEYYDSQTEAAWAAFFTAAQMPFVHEPETFELTRDIWYTPDFYLPDQDVYAEAKNGNANWLACYKAATLARHIGKAVMILEGKPHNLSVYFFGPESTRIADPYASFPANTYADLMVHRNNLGLYGPRENMTPLARRLLELADEARTGWTTEFDPALQEASKARKRALFDSRRVLHP